MFAVAGVAILIGLGVWQLDRKVWKENLIATLTARLARAPADLPPREDWARLKPSDDEYTRVKFPAEFLAGRGGAWSIPPAPPSGPTCRGRAIGCSRRRGLPAAASSWSTAASCRSIARIPRPARKARRRARSTSSASCAGRKRAACSRRTTIREQCLVSARSEGDRRGEEMGCRRAVLYRAGIPGAARRTAQAGQTRGRLPDNHLQYALTWFGLALGLAGVYVTWLVGRSTAQGVSRFFL